MYEKELPFGEPIFFQGEYKQDKVYSLYIQMITCSFKLKKNKIPTIQIKNNRLFFRANEYLENSQNEIVCLVLTNVDLKLFFISIHAPRERSDCGINKKYPQPVFILHKYWIFSDIFQRFWQRKTSFYFFFHCKSYVCLAFAQNIISSQGK